LESERLDEASQHGAMHALLLTTAHFVPIVARQFQLRERRQLDLGHGDEVVEPCLAGGFLFEKPAHLVARGFFGEPWKQRIALSGTVFLERLEPVYEAFDVGRRLRRLLDHVLTQLFHEAALEAEHRGVASDLPLPISGGELRGKAFAIPMGELPLEPIVEELGSVFELERLSGHDYPVWKIEFSLSGWMWPRFRS